MAHYEDGNDLDHLRTDPAFKLAWRAAAGQWRRSVFAADHLALGERADAARSGGNELRHDRPLLRQLRPAAARGDVRHRRHRRRRAWHAATLAVQHASRRTLLSADPRV